MKTVITVETTIQAPVEKVWKYWTLPFHILHWNFASEDWQTTYATNDLRVGGQFNWRMEAKDDSIGFDYWGTYKEIITHKKIHAVLGDDREVIIDFKSNGNSTTITEQFDAETENSIDLQKTGWQAILDQFKKYVEKAGNNEPLHFEIAINASIEKVYQMMLVEKSYAEWTSVFNPTSHYEGNWKKGTKVKFIGSDKDGKEGGMVSRIKENILNKFVSIEHYGILKEGKEITSGPEVELWAGGLENYTFEVKDGQTLLSVDLDTNDDFNNYFKEIYPKALEKLKSIIEK